MKQAAEVLGISSEGARKRIKRGSLEAEKDSDGKVYVWLDGDRTSPDGESDGDRSALVEALQSQIEHLRGQLEEANRANAEHRRLLAAALERIPELEAPSEPRDGHETASEEPGKGLCGAGPGLRGP